ncbi:protein-export chaperone SecB [Solidesulfovibrio sp. C21]|uniref:protein-export chaperone SecB n=1 Tax=Solidesulfovibrio sp. C21 TaxID=3398613 RepID=UPI0039FCCFB5
MADQKTKAPALTMENYFFSEVHVAMNPDVNQENIESRKAFNYDFTKKVDIFANKEENDLYMVVLTITNETADGARAEDITLKVNGLFRLPPNLEEDKIQKLLRILAPSMLYGSAREFLLTITSRGPFPPVYLPTTSFIPEPPTESLEP